MLSTLTDKPRSRAATSPQPFLSTLENVLVLERRRGYDNRAVVGGLGALIERVSAEPTLPDQIRQMIQAYGDQSRDQREATVARALSLLTGVREVSHRNADGPSASVEASTAPATPSDPMRRAAASAAERPLRPRADSSAPGRQQPRVLSIEPSTPISALAGVGPARAKRLTALGLLAADDLRFHFPHRYVEYPPPVPASELGFQHLASFEGTLTRVDVAPMSGRRVKITAVLSDPTGSVAAVWIRGGNTRPTFRVGTRLAVSGSFVRYGRQAYFDNPEYELAADRPLNTRRTVPVYPLTAGISQPFVRAVIRQALERLPPLEESLPSELLVEEQLCARNDAVQKLHWPGSSAEIEAAQRRLAFDEMLPIQLFVLQRRDLHRAVRAPALPIPWPLLAEFRRHLPFALTRAQQRVLSTILEDLAHDEPMARLLQGEVGSGKTVVAAMVILSAVAVGGQAALMAPTEILADQHFRTLEALYDGTRSVVESAIGHPLRVGRLSGSLSRAQRERRLREIAGGEVDLVVGTHAVIQADVEFPNLVLTIVDEQHRFGVGQRLALRQKGKNPHLLVMTATPIPRTLALTLYGDLDVSTIDELPAGRKAITTTLLHGGNRAEAYGAVREEVLAEHQAFVICPLVEGSPATEARAAITEYEHLRTGELAGLRVALLHGRLRGAEKDRVMSEFAAGEHDVLISTSVVEVGIDVPNATVMVIEGAERFGLAQLHQFRGRVGRGSDPSRCFLIAGTESPESLERLSIVERSTDGLELAEEDLRIRGPGDYFGMRQSGFPALRISRLTDLEFVQHVREVARRLLGVDPHLERPEHWPLAEGVRRFAEGAGDAN